MKMKVDNNSKLEHILIEEFPDVTKDILQPGKILVRFFQEFISMLPQLPVYEFHIG